MSLAENIMQEVTGIETRLERRVRCQRGTDIEKAAALLRLFNEMLAADERRAA